MTEFLTITPLTALLIIIGIVIFFVLVIWSIRSHRDPELRVDSDASIDDLMPSLSGLTHSTAVEGNSVEASRTALLRRARERLPRQSARSLRDFGEKAVGKSSRRT